MGQVQRRTRLNYSSCKRDSPPYWAALLVFCLGIWFTLVSLPLFASEPPMTTSAAAPFSAASPFSAAADTHSVVSAASSVAPVLPQGYRAASVTVSDSASLTQALAQAVDGTTITLLPGHYPGHFTVNAAVHLTGLADTRSSAAPSQSAPSGASPGAEAKQLLASELPHLDAGGKGSALTVTVAGVQISGLYISHYGSDSYYLDAGVLFRDGAGYGLVERCVIDGPGFGIRGDNLSHIRIIGNRIRGDHRLHKLDRGDGIYLKRVDDPYIAGNHISRVRDGVYLETVNRSVARDNYFTEQQYGLHYMYTRDDEGWDNLAEQLDGGYALMSSERIHLHDNYVRGAKDFGILLNITHRSRIEDNAVYASRNPDGDVAIMTEGKGIFIYGALDNVIRGNLFEDNDTGINMAMGGEGNKLWENVLRRNTAQVKYVGDRQVEWSHDGRGNFWDDYQGWDFDRNGIGDIAHRPNDSLDKLFWIYPEAKLLMDSPVVLLLRWVERQFSPSGQSGVSDGFPLSQPELPGHAMGLRQSASAEHVALTH
ncbi:nitrous oxide reductase family maturation protein NosD [Shewanella sp. NFH-SH190041]|uniref:nitrous oxide reductase family maturation protein NosD n=1 Tax=Shewanella sp. NFH-SH190041 TaxID=2950245 RepID=UPI0021C34A25|nr:nitrous oxide reductase family maturation protein NosD [Shewanella sp. NFH-SH190041]